ncbi:hypothetical protein K3495_g15771 [Podosphaera aphanis]|nr:hypothetical protein K3495_g15771 [Podosphaera aphanis]
MDEDNVVGQTPKLTGPPSSLPRLIPSRLWSLPYITHTAAMLEAASMIDEERVSQLFASSTSLQTAPAPTAGASQLNLQSRGPSISLYDGKPGNLRSFCSQLVNQIQGDPLASEEAKV